MGVAARENLGEVVQRLVDEYTPGDYVEEWDLNGLWTALEDVWPVGVTTQDVAGGGMAREELVESLAADAVARYNERETELGEELMRALERYLLLQIIDQRWKEHLYDMDYLREGIHLRGFAQIDPLVAYKNEGFTLFEDLINTIWSDFARMIFHVEVEVEGDVADPAEAPAGAGPVSRGNVQYSGGGGATAMELRRGRRRGPGRRGRGARAGGPAAARHGDRDDGAQRAVLVRFGQEVQEVPRRLSVRG